MAWRPLGRVSQRSVTSALRALRRSPGHFATQCGRLASGRISVRVMMNLRSCGVLAAIRGQYSVGWRRQAFHGQLVHDSYKGRASLVALQATAKVHFVLEGPLRALPR
jgi:hypothetical protein